MCKYSCICDSWLVSGYVAILPLLRSWRRCPGLRSSSSCRRTTTPGYALSHAACAVILTFNWCGCTICSLTTPRLHLFYLLSLPWAIDLCNDVWLWTWSLLFEHQESPCYVTEWHCVKLWQATQMTTKRDLGIQCWGCRRTKLYTHEISTWMWLQSCSPLQLWLLSKCILSGQLLWCDHMHPLQLEAPGGNK